MQKGQRNAKQALITEKQGQTDKQTNKRQVVGTCWSNKTKPASTPKNIREAGLS